jgi:hypothetical protein
MCFTRSLLMRNTPYKGDFMKKVYVFGEILLTAVLFSVLSCSKDYTIDINHEPDLTLSAIILTNGNVQTQKIESPDTTIDVNVPYQEGDNPYTLTAYAKDSAAEVTLTDGGGGGWG